MPIYYHFVETSQTIIKFIIHLLSFRLNIGAKQLVIDVKDNSL